MLPLGVSGSTLQRQVQRRVLESLVEGHHRQFRHMGEYGFDGFLIFNLSFSGSCSSFLRFSFLHASADDIGESLLSQVTCDMTLCPLDTPPDNATARHGRLA